MSSTEGDAGLFVFSAGWLQNLRIIEGSLNLWMLSQRGMTLIIY